MMNDTINALIEGKRKDSDVRYLLYSAHDTNIANIWTWLNQNKWPWYECPFASQVIIELHYDKDCLNDKNDMSCFFTFTYFNGDKQNFSPCTAQFADEVEYCNYDVFMRHLNEIKMKGDLDAACYDKFVPLR